MTLSQVARAMEAETAVSMPVAEVSAVSIDTRTISRGDLHFAIPGQRFDGHDFVGEALARGAVAGVVRQDFPAVGALATAPLLRVADVVAALGKLAAYHRRQSSATVIAVTGSNGKTTTKSMLQHVLATRHRVRSAAKSFNNNIGVPLTLLAVRPDDEFLVVELGSNAPGEIAQLAAIAAPDGGIVTSVGPTHLERLGGLEGVRAEKLSLFDYLAGGGLAVVHDQAVEGWGGDRRRADLEWITFGEGPRADIRVSDIGGDLDGTRAMIDGRHRLRLGVPGFHNAVNAAAVFAVGRRLGLEAEAILEALASFTMPEMRLNVVRCGAVTIVNDCYNANPASMAAAIELLAGLRGGRRMLVAGEMAELGVDSERLHVEIGCKAARAGLDVVATVGPRAELIADGAERESKGLTVLRLKDVREAEEQLTGQLVPGDVVLCKGSRVAGLERLVAGLAERLSRPGLAAAGVCG